MNKAATSHDTPAANQQAMMRAYQDAENALSMALHHLRAQASNIPGATRKAVQALAALNDLHTLSPAHQQTNTGRACA
mgnify:FL=1